MINKIHLSYLPLFAKVFVGIFTTLMLLVCAWAVTIYYVEKIIPSEDELSAYKSYGESPEGEQELAEDVELFAEDSSVVLAPIWDSDFAGRELPLDSLARSDSLRRLFFEMLDKHNEEAERESKLRENIGLAHTHINGQTLLFFAMGFVFLFTSATPRKKKVALWLFGAAIVLHAVGLSGEGYHWFFDDILAISGLAILVVIVYMAMRIYVDLFRSGAE
ncbi:MAG: hypothetical protein ACE5K8_08365 [Candidatus Zixiibacteriota bacterium]